MSTTRIYRLAMRTPAALLLVTGAGHLLLPTYGYSAEAFAGWSEQAKSHFLYLTTYMTAAFMFALSLLTFIYANKNPSRPVAWFATVSALLWIVRFFLEFYFPADGSLFLVPIPELAVKTVIGLLALFYALASGLVWGSLLIKK